MRLRTVAAALVLGAAPLLAQTPQRPPTFEVGIEVINLNLSVTDGRNNYVTDLAEKDFAVFEDGIRQELSFYTHENLPISMAVMIDVSASMDEKLAQARAAALRLLKTLRTQDAAEVVQFNDRATVLQDFTADYALLEAAAPPPSTTRSTSPSRT
jgi:Ca-activated chloride channel family protein